MFTFAASNKKNMKKNTFIILLIFSILQITYAQNKDKITILYLLPLQLNEPISDNYSFKTAYDIYGISSFQQIGFWEGARLALQEYESGDNSIKVIVRDITNDSLKLKSILSDKELMDDVDLIIGPFYYHNFNIAAQYAKKYKIPIVNPFSHRSEMLEGNEYVYKMMPQRFAAAQKVKKHFYDKNNANIILWNDSTSSENKNNAYELYFTEENIPYKKILTGGNLSRLRNALSHTQPNVIIALFETDAKVLNQVRLLSGMNYDEITESTFEIPSFSLIVPESWLSKSILDIDFYSLPLIYYFSNYYVNNEDANTLDFIFRYENAYKSHPDILSFSYQGYDITKYFIEYLSKQTDINQLNINMTASKYNFIKQPNGGYENDCIRFIQIKDLKATEFTEE